jgi:hypothetical protein
MTKFHGIVCVDDTAVGTDLQSRVAEQVSPFDLNQVDDGEWDWWQLPESDGPSFLVKPRHVGDPRLVPVSVEEPDRCFGGPLSLLDLDAFSVAASHKAEAWHAWNSTPGAASSLPLSHFLGQVKQRVGYTAQKAREDFAQQPAIREYSRPGTRIWHQHQDPVHRFRGTLEEYLERQAAQLLRCDALVTTGGEWLDSSAFRGSGDELSLFALAYLRKFSDAASAMYVHFHC